ncbi:hypothetical protein [Brevibacterium aurantiacum]|uniref:Uncharacterized protein n=1 Tax=Brevibacterium aurantiacum TaxID=273384 RepID=A0A2H1KNL2_BREAU|nr:hypothetical protein [Brevibacterium aurantiacum]SMY01188.1 hypothetical protein BAURA63_03514 [Brevibacterium aurantiacum]
MTELKTSHDIDPETATINDIFVAMAGDAYKRSLSSGAQFTDAMPFYAAQVVADFNALLKEGYDEMTPGHRTYWLTKRTLADRFLDEWDTFLRTGSHPNDGYTQKAQNLIASVEAAEAATRPIGQADFGNDFTRAIAVVIEEREDDDTEAVLAWLHEREDEPFVWVLVGRFVDRIQTMARADTN